jgi:hypothetical protein
MTGLRFIAVLLLLAATFSLTHAARAADSLRAARDDVRIAPEASEAPAEAKPKVQEDNGWNGNGHHHHDDDDSLTADLWAAAFVGVGFVATSPFWGPNCLIEHGNQGHAFFQAYPYELGDGYLTFDERLDGETPPYAFAWSARLRGEYADDFDSLTRYGGHVLVEHACRWGLDSETNYWRESIGAGAHDHLWTGDANVVVRFAQNEFVQMRSGAGVAWLADDIDSEFGFNFTYGGDIYPIKPLVISAELDAGWIGEAWLIHLRSTVGVQWKQVEVYTGYDYLEIGQVQLDGFVAGVRVTF